MLPIKITKLTIMIAVGLWLTIIFSTLSLTSGIDTQMTWTPIFMGSTNQIDFWTSSETGCQCHFNSSRNDCACCVISGGCNCGVIMPKRCTQCGLEKYCTNMCNITLDSQELSIRSNRGFGQIKSLSVMGPTTCTYKFIPNTGQRLELQVYRLLSIGRHNGKTCEGGWLQLEGGARICGSNARFDQPVVLFSDQSQVTLHMQINEITTRSQFLAYYSFTSKANPSVGWPIKGGVAINDTECDWIYDNCMNIECILASPAYPGLYPPNKLCHYLIKSKINALTTIFFNSVLMPSNQCSSDYIAVYPDLNKSRPILNKLCNNEKVTVTHFGSGLLVEFRSGSEMPPFNWNGFLARVSITEIITTSSSLLSSSSSSSSPLLTTTNNRGTKLEKFHNNDITKNQGLEKTYQEVNRNINECNLQVNGDKFRSGRYDTRGKLPSSICYIILRGRIDDTVHLFLNSYNLSQPACESKIEIWDGNPLQELNNQNPKTIKIICSPDLLHSHKYPHLIRYPLTEYFSSTGKEMTIILRQNTSERANENIQYMDIYYYFHDERQAGTLRPTSGCDVEYHGLTSLRQGKLINPISNVFQIGNYIKCKQHFIPAANQSIVLTVESHIDQLNTNFCTTLCGDNGCHCVSQLPLDDIIHLKLISESNHAIICLCGNYQNWLPLMLRSWSPIYIQWASGLSLTWNIKVQAAYKFTEDTHCGDHSTVKLNGVVSSGLITNNGISNQYYQQKCSWILDSIIDRQLIFTIESSQNRPCTAWNLTIHEYKKSGNPIGQKFYTFCSRDKYKNFTLPWKINSAIVRLQALSRTAPQYIMKWQSITTAANFKQSKPSLTPNYVSKSSMSILSCQHQQITLPLMQFIIIFVFGLFSSHLFD